MILGAFRFKGALTSSCNNLLSSCLKSIQWDTACIDAFQKSQYHFYTLRDQRLPEVSAINFYEDEEHVVLLNGHIYNSDQFFEEGSIAGQISEMYKADNLEFLQHISGDFSVCIFDKTKNEAFLVKDHLGVVPLAFSSIDDTLFFASDTMGLAQGLYGEDKINHEFIIHSFYHFEETYAPTPNKNLHKVLPGHFTKLNTDGFEHIKYWFPECIKQEKKPYATVVLELKKLLVEAIRTRMNANYKVGAHISGGIDSSLISSIARQYSQHQSTFYGFSWSPEIEPDKPISFDERENIQKQCSKDGIDVVYSNFDEKSYHEHLKEWRAPSELLFEANSIREAQKREVNLLFSGWGGDEFVSMGWPYFNYELFWKGRWLKFLKQNSLRKPKQLIKVLLANVFFPRQTTAYLRYKTAPFMYKYIEKGAPSNKLAPLPKSVYRNRLGIHIGLINYKHLSQRCEDWYVNGQRNGIEYRYPLLDKAIVEYVLSIPTTTFIEGDQDRNLIRDIGVEWLVPEIKTLEKKADPVLGIQFNKVLYACNEEYIDELDDFRANEYLQFFNFDALKEDLDKAMKENGKLTKELTLVLPYVKMIHEFTKAFHSKK